MRQEQFVTATSSQCSHTEDVSVLYLSHGATAGVRGLPFPSLQLLLATKLLSMAGVIITNAAVNTMAGQLQGITGECAGGGKVTAPGMCGGVDPFGCYFIAHLSTIHRNVMCCIA
jgi:hypothetical protein